MKNSSGQRHMGVAEYRAMIERPSVISKYHNKKTIVEGITFDSKAEADRYIELRYMEMAYEIRGFKRQPSFLFDCGIRYRPDFIVFGKNGEVWVEDVKGVITKEFRLKQKLWEQEYPWMELRIIGSYSNDKS